MSRTHKKNDRTNYESKKYTVEIDGEIFEVTVHNDAHITASVTNGKRTLHFLVNAAGNPERISVIHGDNSVPVLIEQTGGLTVHLGCRKVSVTVKTPRDLLLEKVVTSSKHTNTQLQILSPLPGLVIKVQTRKGASLHQGENLVIIEAMKMENEIRAPLDCTVREIQVREGQTIQKGHVIALLDLQ